MSALRKVRPAWPLFFLLSFCAALYGQSERGTITGLVVDSSGAVVPGAKITITNEATHVALTVSTNEAGSYTLPSVPPGTYVVRTDKQGFRTSVMNGLVVNAAATVRADATLEVGTSNQTVEVQASALQLQTQDAKSATTLENTLVNDLPLVVGEGADKRAHEIVSLLAATPLLSGRVRGASLVSQRRWNLTLDNGVVIRLPELDPGPALKNLASLERDAGVLEKDILAVDMRQSDRAVFRLSEQAAAARILPAVKKAPKKGDHV